MGPEGKSRRQILTDFRRSEILCAARQIFAERGFIKATMDQIAAEAGIAKGTLYLYFDSKDAIFWTAVGSRLRELLLQTREEADTVVGTRAKIATVVRVRFAFLEADEAFLRMYFTEFGHLCRPAGKHQDSFRQLYLEGAQYIATILDAGIAAGDVRPLPTLEAATVLLDLSRDVFSMRFLGLEGHGSESGHPPPFVKASAFDGERFVFDLFWNGVRA